MKDILLILVVIFLAIITIGLINNNEDECNHKPIEIVKKDTVILHETIYYNKPTPIHITKWKTDTIYLNDTVFIELPIEQKTYTDDSTYNLQISGFKANLDHITVYPKTTIITQEKVREIERKQPYFEFKPSIGLGYGILNKDIDLFVGGSLIFNLK